MITNYNEKQLQILETAEKLFSKNGFDGTSVRDIAEDASVNVAMISYYFGSKEKLLEALFESRIGKVQIRVEALLKDDSLSPIQKVNMLIDEHIERVMNKEAFYKIMLCETATNKNPSLVKTAVHLKVRNAELIGELIKDGQKKGEFKKKVDVILMINTMFGTVWQTLLNKNLYREFYNQAEMSEEEFKEQLKRKLSIHIKALFKAFLTHEA